MEATQTSETNVDTVTVSHSEVAAHSKVVSVALWLWHPISVLLSKLTTWVKSLLTVRDIFFLFIGISIASVIWYFAYNKLMGSFILLGKILHNGRIFDLTEVILK